MNAKHLSKFSISKKLALFCAIIAVAIIAAFSICATTQAKATETNEDAVLDTNFVSSYDGEAYVETYSSEGSLKPFEDKMSIKRIYDLAGESYPTGYTEVEVCQAYIDGHLRLSIFFNQGGSYATINAVYVSFVIDKDAGWQFYFSDGKNVPWVTGPEAESPVPIELDESYTFVFSKEAPTSGINIEGHVSNANDVWQAVPGAFVQYCKWNPWFWDYVPVPEMSTFTDWFGNYTIEGVTEDMLPGVIRVYRFGYEVGESAPIWFVPEGLDTIYRFVEMTPAEPPVPPTPPDPPVPPQPDPPQPVPPTPVPPTPVDPWTNISQTGDSAGIVLAIASMLALCGASAAVACAKRRKFDK